MKTQIAAVLMSVFAVAGFAADASAPAVIPAPQKMESREGTYAFAKDTRIIVDKASEQTGRYLAEKLGVPMGRRFSVAAKAKPEVRDNSNFVIVEDKTGLGPEGYELTVQPKSVLIRAADSAGAFYGVQTVLQLLPPEVFSTNAVSGVQWTMPCVHIQDQPRFAWRGMMLDVSRHFFNKQEVKQVLDSMALHKLNTFHWHLVDDPGWRIEIKKYPSLTEVGAWRKDIGFKLDPKCSTAYGPDGRYGGYYTQADIREIVAYAQSLHITVVPEIEMPGHSIAALAAFPNLSCSGTPYTTDIGAGVHAGIYCAGKDESFEFVQNVLNEVIDLFPSKYIHIGGDEVPKDNWKACDKCQARMKQEGLKNEHELQSYFIRRVEKYINSRGRNLIGWSEIREGGLAQNAAVMDWIGGAVEAASAGHDVVMSPTSECYFDYYQSEDHSKEPAGIGGYLPLRKVYGFEPIPKDLGPAFQSHILGAQGNIWTEYIGSFRHVQYMAYPRLTALSEVAWSSKDSRNWDDFTRRLQTQYKRFDVLGINYRRGESEPLK